MKLFDKVKSKYAHWEGYIDAVLPNGRLRVRTTDGNYEWASPSEVLAIDEVERKTQEDLRGRFDYLG